MRTETKDLVSDITDALYEGVADPRALERCIRMAAQYLNASGGNLHIVSKETLDTLFFAGFGDGYTDETINAYLDHWQYVNAHREAMRRASKNAPGTIFLCHEHISEEEFARAAYFQDFFAKIGQRWLCGGIAYDGGKTEVVITFSRPKTASRFDEHAGAFLAEFLPHVRRATRLGLKLSAARTGGTASLNNALTSSRTPSFLVDRRGIVQWKNAAGEAFLSQQTAIRMCDQCLSLEDSQQTRDLKTLIATAVEKRPSEIPPGFLRVLSGKESVEIDVLPATIPTGALVGSSPLALVMMRDKGLSPGVHKTLKSEHGLTDAECRLAVALADGSSIDDVANTAGTSLHTVRTQLRSVFSKTGVNRQTALAALIWKSA